MSSRHKMLALLDAFALENLEASGLVPYARRKPAQRAASAA